MASAPQASGLPLFYNQLQPLSSGAHGSWKTKPMNSASFLATAHAVPLTVDEFTAAQRFYPIIFSIGENPVPLALMGLNEGVNVFVNEEGQLLQNDYYVPAYVRRYPFMLARLRDDSEDLSLCFDPTFDAIGAFEEGEPLFVDGQPSATTQQILSFCEQFETAGQGTAAFMKELGDNKLLMEGEVAIQPEGAAQPFIYRGFQMVSEDRLRELRGDQLRKFIQSGLLPLVFAHLFSLTLMRELFAKQQQAGKVVPAELPDFVV